MIERVSDERAAELSDGAWVDPRGDDYSTTNAAAAIFVLLKDRADAKARIAELEAALREAGRIITEHVDARREAESEARAARLANAVLQHTAAKRIAELEALVKRLEAAREGAR